MMMNTNANSPSDEGDPRSSSPKQYCSKKPKWWTQLSGRRGTRGQRQAIQRMTARGYCMSKDILTDYSRVDNRTKKKRLISLDSNNYGEQAAERSGTPTASTSSSTDASELGDNNGATIGSCNHDEHDCLHHNDEWKRAWWNRSLGILTEPANQQQQLDMEALKETFAATKNSNSTNINPNTHTEQIQHDKSKKNFKYAHKVQAMYNHTNPLPHQTYQQIWLEIGFGNGDNLLANAKQHQNVLVMGSEIHQPGVGTLLRRMELELGLLDHDGDCDDGDGDEDRNQDNCTNGDTAVDKQFTSSSSSCDNIRIIPGDGIKLLSHLPNNYLDVILITFPDPWPRDFHAHWRVIQREVVYEMHRVLKKNVSGDCGRVYVATDAKCFDEWTREIFGRDEFCKLWEEILPCPDRKGWLSAVSYYEQKGLDEGRSTMLQCWQCL